MRNPNGGLVSSTGDQYSVCSAAEQVEDKIRLYVTANHHACRFKCQLCGSSQLLAHDSGHSYLVLTGQLLWVLTAGF